MSRSHVLGLTAGERRGRQSSLVTLALLHLFLPSAIGVAAAPVRERIDRFEVIGAVARWADVSKRIESSNAPALVGAGRWAELAAKHRDAIEATTTHEAFAAAVNVLIDEAGVSHFHYYTDTERSYWDLRSAFGRGQPETHVTHVGIVSKQIDGRWFVSGILEGSPADGSKISVGDELLSVAGKPYSEIEAFRGREGRPVELRLRRKPDVEFAVQLTPVKGSLYEASQRAMVESVRVIEHDGLKFAYLHAWSTLGPGQEYKEAAKLQPEVDGLIVDYRDGHGGTWFAASRFLLTEGGRSEGGAAPSHWYKPYIVLTADGTRSAKEIVVNEIRKKGRALLVGTETPGHVTAVGGIPTIGEDAMLMLPGFKFDLEGHPIHPDIRVERDIRYCAGADPQLDKGKDVLAQIVRQWEGGIAKAE